MTELEIVSDGSREVIDHEDRRVQNGMASENDWEVGEVVWWRGDFRS